MQFSSTYNLLDSFTFSILACLLTGYCGLFVAMHLFASSGHNDENDVSNDVDDDVVDKDGNKIMMMMVIMWMMMHLFASSGHNDENDVSDDIDVCEDDNNDGEGDNDVDG